jgi:hypothetical protein
MVYNYHFQLMVISLVFLFCHIRFFLFLLLYFEAFQFNDDSCFTGIGS